LLVAAASAAVIGYSVQRKGAEVLRKSWRELRFTAERLQTVESSRALYRGNPALSEIYPDEKDFLKHAETWRPRLEPIPGEPPPLMALFRDRQLLQVHENRSDGHETVRMQYLFPNGAVLEMETDQGKLTDLLLK
ncbi:MAG TPA: hypothetical protein VN436_16390, partial [Holophaga sp.]|nr:hypothetical protein [Holophaga sp.]